MTRTPALVDTEVLLVEDDPDSRELLTTILEGWGCHVVSADSVEAAWRALEQKLPHIIVSDIGLPAEDGYTLLRRVRDLEPHCGGQLPAIALTAYTSTSDRTRAREAGFNVLLPKPVQLEALFEALVSQLGHDAG